MNKKITFSLSLLLILLGLFWQSGFSQKNISSKPAKALSQPAKTVEVLDTLINGIKKTVAIIPIEKEIDPGLAFFVKRAIANVMDSVKPDFIIFKINTFGGRLDAAFDIVNEITSIKKCSTYAYVKQKAISAGAFIALACNKLVMEKGTEIGDCAPILQGGDKGIIMAGEKIESPLRARFRSLAEKNNYPLLLAQAMVSINLHIVMAEKDGEAVFMKEHQWVELGSAEQKKYKNKRTVVSKGELLTMTNTEAQRYHFSQGSFDDIDDFIKHQTWDKVLDVQTNWSEELARLLGKFSPILMLIGFGALYMEFKTPGFGVFGITGIICLAIVFGGQFSAGLADHTELLLLVAGASLILAEIFLMPGTLILAGPGVLLIIVSMILSFQSFTLPDPSFPIQKEIFITNITTILGLAVLALGIPFFSAKFLLPRLSGNYSIIAKETLKDSKVSSVEAEHPEITTGTMGITKTQLRPVGKIIIHKNVFEVQAIAGFIEKDCEVVICQIHGNQILVKEVHPS